MDARARKCTKDSNRHHRYRDRGADRQPGAQAEVGIGSTEYDAEKYSQPDGFECEFSGRFVGRNEGIVFISFCNRHVGFRAQSGFFHDVGFLSGPADDSTGKSVALAETFGDRRQIVA